MARFTFKLPDIGEGISEAEIVAWHVAIGDRVEEDSPIADMMTDKATVEMESPVTGVVVELAGEVGDQRRRESSDAEPDPVRLGSHGGRECPTDRRHGSTGDALVGAGMQDIRDQHSALLLTAFP